MNKFLIKEDIYERNYVVKEKPNGKSKKFTNRRVNKKPHWKEKLDKDINSKEKCQYLMN